MIPANLIVNADDFGLDARVSLAISGCLDEGLINSFSVFPFSDAFHDRLLRDILLRHPETKVGVHLSLVGAAGLREHKDHYRDFLARYLTGRYPVARARGEWKSQVERVGAYVGGPARLAHLDSHQHLHVLPGLWQAARSLQREFGIPRLRVPFESLSGAAFHRFPFGLALQCLSRLRLETGSPRFLGFGTSTCFTIAGNRAGLSEVARRPETTFELMVHPALPSAALASDVPVAVYTKISKTQEREMDELRALPGFFRTLVQSAVK